MTESTVAPLLAAAQAAVDLLRGLRLPAVIVGGFAVAVRGRPRITQDIDLVTLAELTALPDLADAAVRAGFSLRRADAVEFARTTRVLLLRHEPSGIDIDISLGALPFERELVQRATPVRILDRELPIARSDDLVIMNARLSPRRRADQAEVAAPLATTGRPSKRQTWFSFSSARATTSAAPKLSAELATIRKYAAASAAQRTAAERQQHSPRG